MEKERPSLLQGAQKLKAKEAKLAGDVLAEDPGGDGGSLGGDGAGGGRGRGGDGEVDHLIRPEDVGRGNTGTCGTNVECFG